MVILDGMRLEMMEFPFNPVPYICFLLHCALICCCTRYMCLIEFCFVFSFKIKLLYLCVRKKSTSTFLILQYNLKFNFFTFTQVYFWPDTYNYFHLSKMSEYIYTADYKTDEDQIVDQMWSVHNTEA